MSTPNCVKNTVICFKALFYCGFESIMKSQKRGDDMDNKEIFSRNLNYYMNEKNKSRRDVAEAIGVSYFTFTDWVKGKTYPRMDKVELLARYFGIKISDLIELRIIEEKPVESAILHAKILTDSELMESIEEYYLLSETNQKMVRDLIHNLKKKEV